MTESIKSAVLFCHNQYTESATKRAAISRALGYLNKRLPMPSPLKARSIVGKIAVTLPCLFCVFPTVFEEKRDYS